MTSKKIERAIRRLHCLEFKIGPDAWPQILQIMNILKEAAIDAAILERKHTPFQNRRLEVIEAVAVKDDNGLTVVDPIPLGALLRDMADALGDIAEPHLCKCKPKFILVEMPEAN